MGGSIGAGSSLPILFVSFRPGEAAFAGLWMHALHLIRSLWAAWAGFESLGEPISRSLCLQLPPTLKTRQV
jgi:hypothetical protein